MTQAKTATLPLLLILLLFFVSGACGLVYQIVWLRMLVVVFGTSAHAVSTVLTAFMAGLALGAIYFGRRVDRTGGGLRLYGLLELGIALSASAIPFVHAGLDDVYTWIGSGVGSQAMSAELAFLMDPISAVMCLIVTGVGFLIHVYSVGYMDDDHRDDKGFQRFFCYLNLFMFSMLVLVLADNVVLMFLGWEGVGLCSYLLIGFWYSDRYNAYCGSKAFIVNRIGDFGMLVGVFVLFWAFSSVGTPTVSFREIAAGIDRIAAAAERHGKTAAGLVGSPAQGREWRGRGFRMLSYFYDIGIFQTALARGIAGMKEEG